MHGVAAHDVVGAIVDGALIGVGVGIATIEAGGVGRHQIGGVDTACTSRRSKTRHTIVIIEIAIGVGILVANGIKVEGIVCQGCEACDGERRAVGNNDATFASRKTGGSVLYLDIRRTHLTPFEGNIARLRLAGHKIVHSTTIDIHIVDIHISITTVAGIGTECNETVVSVDTLESNNLTTVVLVGDKTFHGHEGVAVVRVTHHTYRDTMLIGVAAPQPERHGQLSHTIDIDLGHDGIIVGAAAHRHLQLFVAGIGVGSIDAHIRAAGQRFPTRRHLIVVDIIKILAIGNCYGVASGLHRLHLPAGGRRGVAEEVEVIGREIIQLDILRQRGALQVLSCALSEPCRAVFHPESGGGGEGVGGDTHRVVAIECGTHVLRHIASLHKEVVDIHRPRIIVVVEHT